jgi:hypothetical protein
MGAAWVSADGAELGGCEPGKGLLAQPTNRLERWVPAERHVEAFGPWWPLQPVYSLLQPVGMFSAISIMGEWFLSHALHVEREPARCDIC